MSNEAKRVLDSGSKSRKVLPRIKEIRNTTESAKVKGGEHPTYQWVKTYDSRCLR
jgi:hypothetical protein